ncbi:TrmH family RNA methyltransferase [Elizabethkingia meningoseptica]|uniref:TrmH family RNA methyltransferase n=1 Tax=Elizabethkingia meningoseptica TaxID=238 RepID=UPI0023AF3076|nr:TrmH family RNA methyltransferase [Elizabethkingia meningoseptica]MDE5431509.1 RNA methyltransferase [Elizabethkingia meningoseptica]
MQIESLQNDKIKRLVKLISKNNERRKNEVFIVEGIQENERAIQFGYNPVEYFICNEIFQGSTPDAPVHFVSAKVYEALAYRGSSEGIIGIYKEKQNHLKDFSPKTNSGIILLESIEKPGNLGAVLRSCEAFGIDAIIITDPKTDFYNPNVIRSSVGCLFGMNFFQTDNQSALEFFKKHDYQIITTFMNDNTQQIQKADFNKKTVTCFGTEHSGLSDFWKDKGSNYLIPMTGSIDSLNLSNAVAITCYEILRQKI